MTGQEGNAMETYAIEVKDLTRRFPGFLLDRVSFRLPSGCIMGLVGENGAGKSTTIRLLLNALRRDSGEVRLLGREAGADVRSLREQVGVVPDELGLPGELNALEVGKIMSRVFRSWREREYTALLQKLDIPPGKHFRELSRGNQMKLGIAVALAHAPRLLLLDEATSGLDPVVRDEVGDMLLDFTRDEDHSILISSHIVSDLEKLCDYIAFLHKGRLLLCEEKDRLAEEYCIIRCAAEKLLSIDPSAILHRKEGPYGAEAVLRRDALPAGTEPGRLGIEELFVHMVRGEPGAGKGEREQ